MERVGEEEGEKTDPRNKTQNLGVDNGEVGIYSDLVGILGFGPYICKK